ncbi:hypothetical protein [Cohnella fermenti]|uniref:Uncharacterized protein n=1 Tax=Cohnella fermenti TaxID=2565925 RepID=A0A4S4BK30_9BACL|nr:hypothetical protein [Cohnella fermenti]THF74089.1 hypothetical protein E6C55_26675 [Cohnella fermenti]
MARISIHTRKPLILLIACLLGVTAGGSSSDAAETSSSYNYSFWGETVAAPDAYEASGLYDGVSLGTGSFKAPNDLHVAKDGAIYVLDSGNNRVVILDSEFRLVRIVEAFEHDGAPDAFNNPQGLFVTDDNHLYIADTGNQRIVHLDAADKLIRIIDHPQSELLADNFQFQPARLVVDKANRIYAMATGVFDGFMEFSSDGTFTSFIGANRVTFSPSEYLWKMLSTRAQKSQMVMFTPTEFTNLDIDSDGFLYATNGQRSDNVRKLNAQGNDILRKKGYFPPEGDVRFTTTDGPTRLVDVDVTDSDMYSILDSSRGRIFTYNGDGYLMYVFGGLGNQFGEFDTPTAIDRQGDDFLVLDKALGEITLFRTTEYGRTLNEAERSYFSGDEEQAYALYEKTIDMNANLEYAYSGIGKALLRQGEYAEAMKYFKRSEDRNHYSKAFLLYRKQQMREYFPAVMTTLIALAAIVVAWRKYRNLKGRRKVSSIEQRVV